MALKILEALRTIRWLSDLPAECLEQLAQFSLLRQVRAGETIFCQGEPSPYCFGVVSGEVRIQFVSKDRRFPPKPLSIATLGDVFGESALFGDGMRSAMATARTDGLLLAIVGVKFREWLKENPVLGMPLLLALCRTTSEHLEKTNKELAIVYGIGRILETPQPFLERMTQCVDVMRGAIEDLDVIALYQSSLYWDEFEPVLSSPAGTPALPTNSLLVTQARSVSVAIALREPERHQWLESLGEAWTKSVAASLIPLIDSEAADCPMIGILILATKSKADLFSPSILLMLNAVASQLAGVLKGYRQETDRQAKTRLEESRKTFKT